MSRSVVSFKFDGSHNQQPVVMLLRNRLKHMQYTIEHEAQFVYRIYVCADNTPEEIMNVCRGIQSNAVYDNTKEL